MAFYFPPISKSKVLDNLAYQDSWNTCCGWKRMAYHISVVGTVKPRITIGSLNISRITVFVFEQKSKLAIERKHELQYECNFLVIKAATELLNPPLMRCNYLKGDALALPSATSWHQSFCRLNLGQREARRSIWSQKDLDEILKQCFANQF